MNPYGHTATALQVGDCALWEASAGVCPAIHARLARRRAVTDAVARAAARRLRAVTDVLLPVVRP